MAVLDAQKALQAYLIARDNELKRITAPELGLPWMVSHPIYQYLARRYGLNSKSVHWEPGEMPLENEWVELDNILTRDRR